MNPVQAMKEEEGTGQTQPRVQTIPVARGDGIGPEIMEACLYVLLEAGARIEPVFVEIGEKVYKQGHSAGITPETWEVLRKHKIFYKAPITTPQGGGYKSLNVTVRKALGLFANVRPAVSYAPVIPTKYPGMDVVVIRENEEDLYAGIEYQLTPEVVESLKVLTRPGCERIVRFAFEYARAYGRRKVTCMTKDNILKITDGLFHKVFDEIAQEYPDIEAEHWIIDIGTAKLADTPEQFDVVVMPNLYGDIASDMLAQIAGSVGLAPGANIGEGYAMFEAIHGSAPRHAGKNKANPSGLLLAGVMMLVHIGQGDVAERVHNAWLKTLEDKIWTYDLVRKAKAAGITDYREVGTREFAEAVVERLGEEPQRLNPVRYAGKPMRLSFPLRDVRSQKMELDGVDVFLRDGERTPEELGRLLEELAGPEFTLVMISNRGQKVYPGGMPETFCSDSWRCRFKASGEERPTPAAVRRLLERIEGAGLEWSKLENLYLLEGERAYSLGQGE